MTNTRLKVLLIEDEVPIRRFLRATLTNSDYTLVEAETGQDGIVQVATHLPDIIVLDLGLPDIDGLEVTRRIREWSTVPIIVLSARGQEHDKIDALDAGADDYLTKPFGVGELLARLRVALRHSARAASGTPDPIFHVGDLRVDFAHRQITVADSEIHLTPTEYKLLGVLIHYAGKVVTQHQLLRDVWGPAYTEEPHYLRVYMGQLRAKLEVDSARPRYLITEAGVGYRLRVDDE